MQRLTLVSILFSTPACYEALKTPLRFNSTKTEERLVVDWPLPTLQAREHSFFSTNATDSANFILRYFKGSRIAWSIHPAVGNKDHKKAVGVEYCPRKDQRCMAMKFVEDTATPQSALTRDRANAPRHQDFVSMSDEEWSRVASAAMWGNSELHIPHEGTYSSWLDFHDGITGETFDVDLAIADGVLLQKYSFGPLRVPLPGTIATIELIGGFTDDGVQKLNAYAGVGNVDKCRDKEVGLEVSKMQEWFWWKATFAAPDPKAAADFAIHALGAQRVESPFSNKGWACPVVEWVVVPDQPLNRTEIEADVALVPHHAYPEEIPSGVMLHFVANPSWPTGDLTISDLAEQQAKIRDLSSDIFDEYMYNHVEFQTASLDPFIARFRKLDLPFIARKGDVGDYFALYVNVPKNNLVFKISSRNSPRLVDARKFDECPKR